MTEVKRRRTNSMTLNVDELEARRRRAGFTQKVLAARAGIEPRTLQRALAGNAVRMDVGHGLARALDVPLQAITKLEEEGPDTLLLWRCADADEILNAGSFADRFLHRLAVSPTQATQEALLAALAFFENDESDTFGPMDLHFVRDMDPRRWIEEAAELNRIIEALGHHGLALYVGSYESTDLFTYALIVVARDSGARRLERVRDKTAAEENEARREAASLSRRACPTAANDEAE